jgi:hypothetical protein
MSLSDRINLAIAIAAACSTVVSVAVVIVTYMIVRANRQTVAVMEAQLLAATRPYVQVAPFVRPMSTLLLLNISNAGATAARNLRLTLDRDYYVHAEHRPDRNLRSFAAFSQPIESLPPKAEFSFHLGVGHKILASPDLSPITFRIKAEYEGAGHRYAEEFVVDLQPYVNSAQPIEPLVERIDKLNEHLNAISATLKRTAG